MLFVFMVLVFLQYSLSLAVLIQALPTYLVKGSLHLICGRPSGRVCAFNSAHYDDDVVAVVRVAEFLPRTSLRRTSVLGKLADFVRREVGGFYTLKETLPENSLLTGSNNFLEHYGLSRYFERYAIPGKLKPDLESSMPHLCGNLYFAQGGDFSSLSRLVEKPPITGKEIVPLSATALQGFRLQPGQVDASLRHLFVRKKEDAEPKEESKFWMPPAYKPPKEKKAKKDKKKKKKKRHGEGDGEMDEAGKSSAAADPAQPVV